MGDTIKAINAADHLALEFFEGKILLLVLLEHLVALGFRKLEIQPALSATIDGRQLTWRRK